MPNEFNPNGIIKVLKNNIVIGTLDLVLSENNTISTGETILPVLDFNNYEYKLLLELNDPSDTTVLTGTLHCYFYNSDQLATPTNVDGSGRRIAKVLHFDPVNDSTTTRSYEYEGYSITSYPPSYNTETLSHHGANCDHSVIVNIHSNALHGLGNSFSNVAYKKVIEYFGDKQSNKGKKETFFKTISDDQTGYGAPFFGRMSYQWFRSLVNTEIIYKTNQEGTFDTVVITQNYYSQIPNLDYKIRTFKASRKRQISCNNITDELKRDEFYYNNYDYRIENLKIDSTLTKEFFYDASDNGNYSILSSRVVHKYDNPMIQIPTRIISTNSDGVLRETEYRYPSDFSINDCYEDCMGNYKSALISCENLIDTCMTELGTCQNIWAAAWSIFVNCQHDNYLAWKNHPLKLVGAGRKDCHKDQEDYLLNYGYYDCLTNIDCDYLACYLGVLITYQVCQEGIKNCIHEKFTNASDPFEKALHYLAWLNLRNKPAERSQLADDVLIDRYKWYYDVYMTGDTIPLLHSIARDVPGEGFLKELEVLAYDSRNNVIHEKLRQDGQDVAYIWGVNFSYPMARVENAMPDQVYYEGFEEHPNGEIFLSSGIGLSKSGIKALNSGNFTFPSNFQPPAGVRLSYWYYQNNKWNYHEGEFNQVINSGGTWLDEIRVFPSNSLMITYAFDGFGRLISSTDERNITTYYQYDHLGRLVMVRDDNGDILKQYEYNYAN